MTSDPGLSFDGLDALISEAVGVAAERMAARNASGERVLESDLDRELATALRSKTIGMTVREEGHRRNYPLPGWDPRPGGPDLAIYSHPSPDAKADDQLVAIVEDKWSLDGNNLFELANDVFKVIAAYGHAGFCCGYLVAGAPKTLWGQPVMCADWFGAEVGRIMRLRPAGFLAEYDAEWREIRALSAGEPQTFPEEIELKTLAVTSIRIRNKAGSPQRWSVRCVRATPTLDEAVAP